MKDEIKVYDLAGDLYHPITKKKLIEFRVVSPDKSHLIFVTTALIRASISDSVGRPLLPFEIVNIKRKVEEMADKAQNITDN